MFGFLSKTALVAALTSGATTALSYTSDGHSYELECNSSGYVLESEYPVTRLTGQGAATREVKGIEKIYLGKSCDAYHAVFGNGSWCWANGGFVAQFPTHRFGFARQELYCPDGNDSVGLNCAC